MTLCAFLSLSKTKKNNGTVRGSYGKYNDKFLIWFNTFLSSVLLLVGSKIWSIFWLTNTRPAYAFKFNYSKFTLRLFSLNILSNSELETTISSCSKYFHLFLFLLQWLLLFAGQVEMFKRKNLWFFTEEILYDRSILWPLLTTFIIYPSVARNKVNFSKYIFPTILFPFPMRVFNLAKNFQNGN